MTPLFPEELNILYDSQCNVCRWEVAFLRRRDASLDSPNPRLKLTDIEGVETPGPYDPSHLANANISYAQALASMHAVTKDGQVLVGVPVFARAYGLVGLGWVFGFSQRVPIVRRLMDRLYGLFAKYRTVLTRGSSQDDLVRRHQELQQVPAPAPDDCERCRTKTMR